MMGPSPGGNLTHLDGPPIDRSTIDREFGVSCDDTVSTRFAQGQSGPDGTISGRPPAAVRLFDPETAQFGD